MLFVWYNRGIYNKRKDYKMEKEAKQNREDILEIKTALALGYISYDEAKREAGPILEKINLRGKNIAKKYGKKFYPITFMEIMR